MTKLNTLTNINFNPLFKPIPISQHDWPIGTVPLVTIKCMTYNHVEFIHDAIQGFLDQETTFPVEICIHDDASDDGTSDIINRYREKYPKLIKVFVQKFNTYKHKDKVKLRIDFQLLIKGNFIASCEGDDCWIFNRKLESQIDLIKKNPKLKFVGGRSVVGISRDTGVIDPPPGLVLANLDSNSFFKGVWLHTNTRLIERGYHSQFAREVDRKYRADLGFVLYSIYKSRLGEIEIGGIDDVVGFYRVNGRGVWSSLGDAQKFISNVRYIIYFMQKYKELKEYHKYLMDNLEYFVKDFTAKKERIRLLQGLRLAFGMFRAGVDFKFIVKFLKNSVDYK